MPNLTGETRRSLIGVVNDAGGPPLCRRHVKRVEDELGLEVAPHRPADDAARDGVQNHGEAEEAGPGRDVGS